MKKAWKTILIVALCILIVGEIVLLSLIHI